MQHNMLGANEPKAKQVNTGPYLLKCCASKFSRQAMMSPWCPEVQQCKPGLMAGHLQWSQGSQPWCTPKRSPKKFQMLHAVWILAAPGPGWHEAAYGRWHSGLLACRSCKLPSAATLQGERYMMPAAKWHNLGYTGSFDMSLVAMES